MKFLCENCKAKYQIADEKVAGRTVRMKCRKCGHMIEVEASVTETSVAAKLPQDNGGGASTGVSGSHGAVRAAAAGLPPPRPGLPPPRRSSGPAAPRTSTAPQPPAAPRPASGAKPAPRPGASPGAAGLAGAFSKTVTVPNEHPSSVSAAMAVLSSSSSTDEWYVGINGVPVGPVRLSELRRKAAGGLITEESLVWREGFEEWLPLRTFPELVAMLKEAGTRTSLTPPPPQAAPMTSTRPQAPPTGKAAASLGPGPRPAPAPRGAPAPARNNVVALASRRATAEKIEGLGEPVRDDEIHFEAAAAAPPAVSASPLPPPSPSIPAPSPTGHSTHSGLGTRFAESRRAHPAAWLVVGLGGMFLGVAAMVFLLPKGNSKPAVQIVSVMVPTPPPPPTAGEGEGMTTIGPIEVSAPTATKPTGGSKGAKATEPGAGAPATLSTGLTGLTGLVGGPAGASGPISKSGGGGPGPLQTADLERAVQSHRAFVKRQCWDAALANRAPGAPSSVRVVATITVAPDGHVQSANAQGGEAYPGLATCVQGQVKSWTFPPSDGGTFSVPFIFAAQ